MNRKGASSEWTDYGPFTRGLDMQIVSVPRWQHNAVHENSMQIRHGRLPMRRDTSVVNCTGTPRNPSLTSALGREFYDVSCHPERASSGQARTTRWVTNIAKWEHCTTSLSPSYSFRHRHCIPYVIVLGAHRGRGWTGTMQQSTVVSQDAPQLNEHATNCNLPDKQGVQVLLGIRDGGRVGSHHHCHCRVKHLRLLYLPPNPRMFID
jgi:hypothetical protein